ncbi:MAG: alanine--tRNA ligase-related protein [Oscillospiraceae bacterium]|nr:alanine--tRNA ligase-related protein [Oscillospiraceae bacterium]
MDANRLYYKNPYAAAFSARVTSCAESAEGWLVTLDNTAFYPEGGGQPGDTGTLGGVRVLDTQEADGEAVHLCSAPLAAGSEVEGCIDWPRRFDLMQQHSGEHIVSGIVHRRFGWDNVGFHMGADVITVDFSGPLSAEELRSVEREANEAVWSDTEFETLWPTAQELEHMDFRSKKELDGSVRIVRVGGWDLCACCGTHVSRAGEIGLIKILSAQKLRGGTRIEMVCGSRAYDYVSAATEQNRKISALLSAKPLQTAESVQRLQSEEAAVRYRMVGLENALIELKAEAQTGRGDIVLFEEGFAPDAVRRLCAAAGEKCGGRCAVFSGTDAEGYKYAVCERGGDLRAFVKELNGALSGSGGGKPDFVQGSVKATRAQIAKFFD